MLKTDLIQHARDHAELGLNPEAILRRIGRIEEHLSRTGRASGGDSGVVSINGFVSGGIKTVNGIAPDAYGNVVVSGGGGGSITSVNGYTGPVIVLTTSDIAEGSNLYYTNVRADARITAQKGVANGLATLDGSGLIPTSQLPALAITDTFVVASQAAMLALTAQTGDVAVRTDLNKSFILTASPATLLANWQELLTPTDTVLSVNGQIGAVVLTGTTNRITVGAATGVVDISASYVGQTSITTLGTITTGTWTGTTIAVANGGTGQTSYTNGQLLIGNSTGNTLTKATLTGTANQITVTNGAGSITLSLPSAVSTGSLTLSSLTAGRIPFASTAGLLADSANLAYDVTNNQVIIGSTPTSNQRFGILLNDGAYTALGRLDENTTDVRVSMGLGPSGDTGRVLFGGTLYNWQIDALSGIFRWFTPGTVQMFMYPNSAGNQVDFATNKDILGVGTITVSQQVSLPAAPAAGVKVFGYLRVGENMLSQRSINSFSDYQFQPSMANAVMRYWKGNGNGVTPTNYGFSIGIGGTLTTRTSATTSHYTYASKAGYVATSAAINQPAGIRHQQAQFGQGNSTDRGGFKFTGQFGFDTIGTGFRLFAGMFSNTAATSTTDPSAEINFIGICKDAADTTFQFMTNDGTSTATKTTTGITPVVGRIYEFTIKTAPNSSTFYLEFKCLDPGALATQTLTVTTDIPVNTTMLAPRIEMNSGTYSAVAVGIDIVGMYLETKY